MPDADFVGIVIDAPDLCLRYSAALIEGLKIGPSPFWMQQRLRRAGMRPISNVVDITNYVMLEIGQPLHAFDYDLLRQRAGGERPSHHHAPRPSRRTPDYARRRGSGARPRHADDHRHRGPIAVGGVMGGANTEVNDGTTSVLLEAANFNFLSIRRTSQLLKLSSEAAGRFGKRVDPELTVKALARAGELLAEVAGGTARPLYGDVYPGASRSRSGHRPRPGLCQPPAGCGDPGREMVRILEALEFQVRARRRGTLGRGEPFSLSTVSPCLRVTVPSHRQDVNIPADLVEEIGRIYGYDRLTPRCWTTSCRRNAGTWRSRARRRCATSWPARAGRGHHVLDDRRAGRSKLG